MSSVVRIHCDACDTVTNYSGSKDWIRLGVGQMGSFNQRADLCSWRCVMSYSADKANAEWLAASGITVNAP